MEKMKKTKPEEHKISCRIDLIFLEKLQSLGRWLPPLSCSVQYSYCLFTHPFHQHRCQPCGFWIRYTKKKGGEVISDILNSFSFQEFIYFRFIHRKTIRNCTRCNTSLIQVYWAFFYSLARSLALSLLFSKCLVLKSSIFPAEVRSPKNLNPFEYKSGKKCHNFLFIKELRKSYSSSTKHKTSKWY